MQPEIKKEYGQTKVMVNAHMDEIINLSPVKGSVRQFSRVLEKASKNFDALLTLGEGDRLHEFVMTTLNCKLLKIKPQWKKTGRTGRISPWNNLLMLCRSGLEETTWKAKLIIKEGQSSICLRRRKKSKHHVAFPVENKVTGAKTV